MHRLSISLPVFAPDLAKQTILTHNAQHGLGISVDTLDFFQPKLDVAVTVYLATKALTLCNHSCNVSIFCRYILCFR